MKVPKKKIWNICTWQRTFPNRSSKFPEQINQKQANRSYFEPHSSKRTHLKHIKCTLASWSIHNFTRSCWKKKTKLPKPWTPPCWSCCSWWRSWWFPVSRWRLSRLPNEAGETTAQGRSRYRRTGRVRLAIGIRYLRIRRFMWKWLFRPQAIFHDSINTF